MNTIVVGLDGSKHAEAALDFAAKEAEVHGAALVIVTAWEMPTVVDPMAAFPGEWITRLEEDARSIVQAGLERVKRTHPQVAATGKAVEGHPPAVLLEAGQDADLIVMGSHGRGEFATLLLGSVTQQVIHNATIPVVVVRVKK